MTDVFTDELKDELLRIFDEIVAMALPPEEWPQRESSDMFQSEHFCGGYDATERQFLFSYFPAEGGEFWFGFALDDIEQAVSARELPRIDMALDD